MAANLDDLSVDELRVLKKLKSSGLNSLSVDEAKVLKQVKVKELAPGKADVLSTVERLQFGLLDPKFAKQFVEQAVPGSKVIDADGQLLITQDGGRSFNKIKGSGLVGDVAEIAGRLTPLALGVGGAIAGSATPLGPIGGVAAGGAASQAIKEAIEEFAVERTGGPEQNIGERFLDTGLTALGDATLAKGFDTLFKTGKAAFNTPFGQKLRKEAAVRMSDTTRPFRGSLERLNKKGADFLSRFGSVSDEITKTRAKVAEGALLDDLFKDISNRTNESAGKKLQGIIGRKIDADGKKMSELWRKAETSFNKAIQKNGKLNEQGLVDFKRPFQAFSNDFDEALLSTSDKGLGANVKNSISQALGGSRQSPKTRGLFQEAGLSEFDPSKVTGKDLFRLRRLLGSQIEQVGEAGEQNMKRVLTRFKDVLDERIARTNLPGSNLAREAIKTQRESFKEVPLELRESLFVRQGGINKPIDPEVAFEKVFKLPSESRKTIGQFLRKNASKQEVDDLAKDTQAFFFNKNATKSEAIPLGIKKDVRDEVSDLTQQEVKQRIAKGGRPKVNPLKKVVEESQEKSQAVRVANPSTVLKQMGVTPEGLGDDIRFTSKPLEELFASKEVSARIVKPIERLEQVRRLGGKPNSQTGIAENIGQALDRDVVRGAASSIPVPGPVAQGLVSGAEGILRPTARLGANVADQIGAATFSPASPVSAGITTALSQAGAATRDFNKTSRPKSDENLIKLIQLSQQLGDF